MYSSGEELEALYPKFNFEPSPKHFNGAVFIVDERLHVCFKSRTKGNKEFPTPGIIAHESKHIVNHIFEDVCQRLDLYNDEAECYLLGWVVDRIHEFINQK